MKKLQKFFPLSIDSTMLSAFHRCERYFVNRYFYHLSNSDAESIHLAAGRAFADGIEAAKRAYWEQGFPASESVRIGREKLTDVYLESGALPRTSSEMNKSLENMISAFNHYFVEWSLPTDHAKPLVLSDGTRALEWHFAVELPYKHPVYGTPLLFEGTLDAFVEAFGGVWISDEKTAGRKVGNVSEQFSTRGQFLGYYWAAKKLMPQLAGRLQGALVRHVVTTKVPAVEEAPVSISDALAAKWYTSLCDSIERMLFLWEFGTAKYNFSDGCNVFARKCQFAEACTSDREEQTLQVSFEQNIWLPSLRQNMPLLDFISSLEGDAE